MLLGQELYVQQGNRKKSLTVIYKMEPNGSINIYGVLPEGNVILNNLRGQMKSLPSLEVSVTTYKEFYSRFSQQ